jgi:predicted transcriptional regulator
MSEKSTPVKPAKMCYSHIGGKLGQLLVEAFVDKGWIAKNKPTDKHFYITDLGEKEFRKLGLDLSKIKSENL